MHVSTIHSFLWSLIRSFQFDIQYWVAARIGHKREELQVKAANFGPRVQQRTRAKNQRDIDRYQQLQEKISRVRSFNYGTGSDYSKGILGHDDIIKMVPQLLAERPLFRTLLAQQYPFVFVDESQDTSENLVTALKAVDQDHGSSFCLGFFGDPMQRIYPTGVGTIQPESGWLSITKSENFRSPTMVLDVANAIRRDGDQLAQTRGRMVERDGVLTSVSGSASIFVLPIDHQRDQRLAQVRAWAATRNADPAWLADTGIDAVKVLVIVHRMAAKRLGFGDLYAAFNDRAPEAFKSGFMDAGAWPLRPFISFVLPLVDAARNGREFDVMQILRSQSPLIHPDNLRKVDVASRLRELRDLTGRLERLMAPESTAKIAQILTLLHKENLIPLESRLLSYLNNESVPSATTDSEVGEVDGEELSREIAAMDAFLSCRATQFWGYRTYINEKSPFSTQQGIKGAEFDRVLVVLDDEESTHNQFSYEKYFGIKPLSDADNSNIREGKETSVERTRRLFYVCCTRAMKDLIVVLFSGDVASTEQRVRALRLFAENAVHTHRAL